MVEYLDEAVQVARRSEVEEANVLVSRADDIMMLLLVLGPF